MVLKGSRSMALWRPGLEHGVPACKKYVPALLVPVLAREVIFKKEKERAGVIAQWAFALHAADLGQP